MWFESHEYYLTRRKGLCRIVEGIFNFAVLPILSCM